MLWDPSDSICKNGTGGKRRRKKGVGVLFCSKSRKIWTRADEEHAVLVLTIKRTPKLSGKQVSEAMLRTSFIKLAAKHEKTFSASYNPPQ